ncbi:hypothetical protein [Tenacibaculum sp. 190524A05c]|uniref:hypothetical protein n=1 Tax=Tenacibaculum platacis TaxID=3137852 RepID=UPI0032B2F70B
MRVFVLCTGRSGSLSFVNACKHIRNFTTSHESLADVFGNERFNFPNNHIEVDNRLSWSLGHLNKYFGDDAIYIHLKRDRDKTANSFFQRFYLPGSIIDAFCDGVRMNPVEKLSKKMRLKACYDYVDTVNTNIEYFLLDKSKKMTINLETIEQDFPKFLEFINADIDLEKGIEELRKSHNSSFQRKLNLDYRVKLTIIREWRHLKMYFSKKS